MNVRDRLHLASLVIWYVAAPLLLVAGGISMFGLSAVVDFVLNAILAFAPVVALALVIGRIEERRGIREEELTDFGLRVFLVVLFASILLLWAPIDGSRLWLRTGYLILLPAGLFFALRFAWAAWRPSPETSDRLKRALAATIAGVLFVGAYVASQREYHEACTQSVQTRDGTECVGDYVTVPGPDRFEILLLIASGVGAFGYAVRAGVGAGVRGTTRTTTTTGVRPPADDYPRSQAAIDAEAAFWERRAEGPTGPWKPFDSPDSASADARRIPDPASDTARQIPDGR